MTVTVTVTMTMTVMTRDKIGCLYEQAACAISERLNHILKHGCLVSISMYSHKRVHEFNQLFTDHSLVCKLLKSIFTYIQATRIPKILWHFIL